MHETQIYIDNTFGLKTLDETRSVPPAKNFHGEALAQTQPWGNITVLLKSTPSLFVPLALLDEPIALCLSLADNCGSNEQVVDRLNVR